MLIFFLTFSVSCTTRPADKNETNSEAVSLEFISKFFTGDTELLYSNFSSNMVDYMTEEEFAGMSIQVRETFGSEYETIEYSDTLADGLFQHISKLKMATSGQLFLFSVWLNDDFKVEGFNIAPVQEAAENPHTEYLTKSKMNLPFTGEWYVVWGGRTIEQNYHAAYMDQRFAYDLLIVKNGSSYQGDKEKNESYFCFGEPVISPADGVVVAVTNNVPDNIPGVMNPEQPAGNYVVIDHENGEFSIIAHFMKDSICVQEGDRVSGRDLLGLCGNSGNSSEAHIHYHIQDSGIFGAGFGFPIQFVDYYADNEYISRGEPVQNQVIRNALE